MPQIDLIWLSDFSNPPEWPLGQVYTARQTPQGVATLVLSTLPQTKADAWLFWDASLGAPRPQTVLDAFACPGDAWHCGLRMGLSDQPGIIDFIDPTWMLNADPRGSNECTSWRLSLRCCLVRTAVLQALSGPHPAFLSLDAASLELGLRWIRNGVFTRHLPWLLPENFQPAAVNLQIEDEVRFAYHSKGRRWTIWAVMRAILTGYSPVTSILKAARTVLREPYQPSFNPFVHPDMSGTVDPAARVTVLIPTLDRYPYLRALLDQLRAQTVPPLEIIIIDQTALNRRDQSLQRDFRDLPIQIIYLDKPGQSTARNAGLARSSGNFILFIDDDVDIKPDLIELHLKTMQQFHCDVSSGVALDPGSSGQPAEFRITRCSDVFPTNNSLIASRVLNRSGLFDPHYDFGPRADHDLGMRIYLSGTLLVLNHQIKLIHHHAPAGGLRAHKARVVTRASSRGSLVQRHIPAATEIYLGLRYFTPRQVHEMILLRTVGTLFGDGNVLRKLAKFAAGLLLLPDTLLKTRANAITARQLFQQGVSIPSLARSSANEGIDAPAAG